MASRPVRWLDKAILGAVMAVAAFVLERIVIRASKKTTGEDPRDAAKPHTVEGPHMSARI